MLARERGGRGGARARRGNATKDAGFLAPIESFAREVAAHAAEAQVQESARDVRKLVLSRFDARLVPDAAPNYRRGAELYAQNCAPLPRRRRRRRDRSSAGAHAASAQLPRRQSARGALAVPRVQRVDLRRRGDLDAVVRAPRRAGSLGCGFLCGIAAPPESPCCAPGGCAVVHAARGRQLFR